MKPVNHRLTLSLIALSSALLAISMFLMGPHKSIDTTLNFYQLSPFISTQIANVVAAFTWLVIALVSIASIKKTQLISLLGYLIVAVSLVPLLSLFSSTMWIESLGGFPVIGAGQGVIKYFALFSLGLLFINSSFSKLTKLWLSIFPVMLVLLWIGGMKFTLLEAQGIEALVKSSPLMSWMYLFWDIQTTSNIIGIYDLLAVVLLILAIYKHQFVWPAILLSGAVFLVTQTFLITWDAALSSETFLSTGGHFLIKDLWFIANLIVFSQLIKQKKRAFI